jgi:hypothetical protein
MISPHMPPPNIRVPRPPHPAVDWRTESRDARGLMVAVTCPVCQQGSGHLVSGVLQGIKRGTFTGRCVFCAAAARRGKKVLVMKATLPEIKHITLIERQRCIGIVLNEFGLARMRGQDELAKALDALAVRLEHPEHEGH